MNYHDWRLSRKMLCCFISIFLKSDLLLEREREEEWGERANWICLHKSAKWAAAEQIEWIIARLCLSSSPTTTTTTDDDDSKQSIKFGFLHLEFPTWTMIDRLVISALSCNSENLLTCSVYSLSLPRCLIKNKMKWFLFSNVVFKLMLSIRHT